MKIAVVTPYFNESDDYLRTCHESVMAQTHACTHFMVSDGRPRALIDSWNVQHLRLPTGCADYGDTPRGVGSVLAIGQGFDAIAYLDADNWYYPEHVSTLVAAHRHSGAAVVSATRNLHRLDGTLLGKCNDCDGENFVDVNCFFLTRPAFRVVQAWWMMPSHLHPLDDRVLFAYVRRLRLSHKHCAVPTVAYRTAFAFHYKRAGEQPPPGAKSGQAIANALYGVDNLATLADSLPI